MGIPTYQMPFFCNGSNGVSIEWGGGIIFVSLFSCALEDVNGEAKNGWLFFLNALAELFMHMSE